jgi:excisionase family DNA binding protein
MDPISVTVPEACRLVGLGRTKLYELIDEGRIETTTIGSRRLVRYASLKRLIEGAASAKVAA